jgi:hypothetical protein
MIAELFEELVKLALQHLDVLQISPEILGRHKRFLQHGHRIPSHIGNADLVSDPVENLVALANKVQQLQCLLQSNAFILQLEEELIPESVQLLQTFL